MLCDALMDQILGNVSSTLLNLCHEEFRQPWMQNVFQSVPNEVAVECVVSAGVD